MIKAAIVEDDPGAAELLAGYLKQFAQEQHIAVAVSEYRDAVSFLDQYRPTFDIIFMDVEMPYMDGIKAAQKLREIDREVVIVFVTNMAQYAVKGYEVNALDYIVKPVGYPDFSLKMKRAVNALQIKEEREIVIPLTNQGLHRVSVSKLLYVEVSDHKLRYHLADDVLETGGSLSKVETELCGWGFLRCNSCYLVNPRHIEWVRGHVVKVGQDELQISHPKRKEFIKGLAEWLAKGG